MIINNYKNEKFIKWIVNNSCNYRCSYCFEKDFHKKEIDEKNIIKTAYKIKDFISKNNLTSIILLGGELFLLEKNIILQILDILKEKKISLYIISNFSQKNSIYKEIYNYAKEKFKKVEYKFSFHDEYVTIDNFFKKAETFLKDNQDIKLTLQFTLDKRTYSLLQEFMFKFNLLKEKYNVKLHVEKAYYFNKNRTKINFVNVNINLPKFFKIDNKLISANEIFKDGPLDNYNARCYQPFFHLENNILYSHCYGRIITKDFLNYNAEKIDFNFICNRHSCLIYKTSIIQKNKLIFGEKNDCV